MGVRVVVCGAIHGVTPLGCYRLLGKMGFKDRRGGGSGICGVIDQERVSMECGVWEESMGGNVVGGDA